MINTDSKKDKEFIAQDLTEKFVEKVGIIIDEIDDCKKELLENKFAILKIANRLDSLFDLIEHQLGEEFKLDIKRQNLFSEYIEKINLGKYKRVQDETGNIVNRYFISHKNYITLKTLCKKRELHLYRIMDGIGLSAKKVTKQRRVR